MEFVKVSKTAEIGTVTLARGKVNALNEEMVEELRNCFEDFEKNEDIKAILLTGRGKFFSFGFDVPEFLGYSKDDFIRYLEKFTDFYTYLFLYPKPLIAALNGHTIAGGCMLATTCDYRIMVSEKARIGLNEITFGASILAGSVEMLKFCVGDRNAETMIYTGTMYEPKEAARLGLIHQITSPENLLVEAETIARNLIQKNVAAFTSIKGLLRRPIAEEMVKREMASIQEFSDIWYSKETWSNLQDIKIHP